MNVFFKPNNQLKRYNNNSEDYDINPYYPSKKIHCQDSIIYNICNNSLHYLPSFHIEREEISQNNEIKPLKNNEDNNYQQNNFQIDEFIQIAYPYIEDEDTFLRDLPNENDNNNNNSELYNFWEFEVEDFILLEQLALILNFENHIEINTNNLCKENNKFNDEKIHKHFLFYNQFENSNLENYRIEMYKIMNNNCYNNIVHCD